MKPVYMQRRMNAILERRNLELSEPPKGLMDILQEMTGHEEALTIGNAGQAFAEQKFSRSFSMAGSKSGFLYASNRSTSTLPARV